MWRFHFISLSFFCLLKRKKQRKGQAKRIAPLVLPSQRSWQALKIVITYCFRAECLKNLLRALLYPPKALSFSFAFATDVGELCTTKKKVLVTEQFTFTE
jgi:hypothetical protein